MVFDDLQKLKIFNVIDGGFNSAILRSTWHNMKRQAWEEVYKILTSQPDYTEHQYLELGCGDGIILERLSKSGASAVGTTYLDRNSDYIRSREYPDHVVVDYGIDLNAPLPYHSGSFDVVYSIEVLEHIENHSNFIGEASRVLRKDGLLILTTPNLHRLVSRIHFALTGLHLVKERRPPYSASLSQMGEFHIRCPDFPLLHWLLWQNNLHIISLTHEYVHPISRVLAIVAPLVRQLTKRGLRLHQRDYETVMEPEKDLERWMNSDVLLSSERLILIARKSYP